MKPFFDTGLSRRELLKGGLASSVLALVGLPLGCSSGLQPWLPSLDALDVGSDHFFWDHVGNKYRIDDNGHAVSRLASDGSATWTHGGTPGSDPDQLNYPTGMAASPQGRIYVVDNGNSRLVELDPTTGMTTNTFGSPGGGLGQLSGARAAACDSDGNVWAADAFNSRVQSFTPDGATGTVFGTFGGTDVQDSLSGPRGIALGPDGLLHVLDTANARVQVFDHTGTWQRSYTVAGASSGNFLYPRSIRVASTGHSFVSDPDSGGVQVFDPSGNPLLFLGNLTVGSQNATPLDVETTPDSQHFYVRVELWTMAT